MFDIFHVPFRTSLHERKVAAWALFVGERSRDLGHMDRAGRPHPGLLPDVDPRMAVDPAHPPRRVGRLIAVLRRMRSQSARQPMESEAVGKSAEIAYIDCETQGGTGDGPFVQINIVDQFRAA